MNGIYYPIISEPSGFEVYDGTHKEAIIDSEGIASAQLGRTLYHDWDIFPDSYHKTLPNDLASDSYADIFIVGSLCFVFYHFTATSYAEWQLQISGLPHPPVDIYDYREFGNTLGLGYVKISTDGYFYTYTKTQKKRISGTIVYPIDTDASEYKNVIRRYAYKLQRSSIVGSSGSGYSSFNGALSGAMAYVSRSSYSPKYIYHYSLAIETRSISPDSSNPRTQYMLVATIKRTNFVEASSGETDTIKSITIVSSTDYGEVAINSTNMRTAATAVTNEVLGLLERESPGYYYVFICSMASSGSNPYSYTLTGYNIYESVGISTIDLVAPQQT